VIPASRDPTAIRRYARTTVGEPVGVAGQKDVVMDILEPKDHGEAVALFRSEVVGVLTRLDLPRGELAARLKTLSEQRFRPPGATTTRTFAVPTLTRWYRLYKRGGLAALCPTPRADRGAARALTPEQQELVCEIGRGLRSDLMTSCRLGRLNVGGVAVARCDQNRGRRWL
jgi:putative transposase